MCGCLIVNILLFEENECIIVIFFIKEFEEGKFVFMVMVNGMVKKIDLSLYFCLCLSGIIVVNLNEGDELIGVDIIYGDDDIMLFFDVGKVVCFNEKFCDSEIGEVKCDLEIGEEFLVFCFMGRIVIGVCGICL